MRRQKKGVVAAVLAAGMTGCAGGDVADSGTANAALVQPMPGDDVLCKPHVGTPLDASGFRVYGTHVEDVEGVWGAPAEKAANRMVYVWRKGSEDVRVTLDFEPLRLCYRQGGAEVKPGLWLKTVTVSPSTEMRDCWKPDQTNTNGRCGDECIDSSDLRKCG